MSESHECTQMCTQIDATQMEDDLEEVEEWGRLMSSSAANIVHLLMPKGGKQTDDVDVDMHTVGRNSQCDIVLKDARVSGFHCRLYRRFDKVGRFKAYIEDTSSNGTWVNRVRLPKRGRRELASGDVVALMSPTKDKDRAMAFTFINLSDQQVTVQQRQVQQQPRRGGPLDAQQVQAIKMATGTTQRRVELDYDIREELGAGSIGKVYKAISRESGDHWAVKIISLRQLTTNIGSLSPDDILHEANILRDCAHPAIVKIGDVYWNDQNLCIVMQLVVGGDLFDRILKLASFSETDARGLMTNLLSALAYLHERGIAHRDIKPENILMRSTESNTDVLLTDFGLAKFMAVGPQACQTFCGTPQYLAPEVLVKQQSIDDDVDDMVRYDGAAADCWSTGVVLYVLLSGTQPSKADWLLVDPVWATVSDEAKDVIRDMTIIDVASRPAITQVQRLPWFQTPPSNNMPPPPALSSSSQVVPAEKSSSDPAVVQHVVEHHLSERKVDPSSSSNGGDGGGEPERKRDLSSSSSCSDVEPTNAKRQKLSPSKVDESR